MARLPVALTALVALFAPLASAQVQYTLAPDVAGRQLLVSVRLDKARTTEEFRIPAWCPGFYFIQNYEKKLSDLRAADESGRPLQIARTDGRGWRVDNPAGGPISFSYRVLADDVAPGFFGSSIVSHTAFVNGPSAFVYVDGRLEEPCSLTLRLAAGWDVATAMPTVDGTLRAADYDEFIDHPIQMGKFERRNFTAGGKKLEAIYVSLTQRYAPDLDYETERLRRIAKAQIDFFGAAPFDRYVFIVHLAPGNFPGGLEHRASTVLNVWNADRLDLDYLASHEFFHTWNVKRIRPKVLGPFDYTKQVRTRNLWFAEGVTDYYAHVLMHRAGLRDATGFLQGLADEIGNLQNSKVRKSKTVEDASWDAWENGGFGIGDLSYYTKGLVIGLLFDAAIRNASDGERSLDDLMRRLMKDHAPPKPGYGEDDLRIAINNVAGKDLSPLYNRLVRSTQEMPYDLLHDLGLRWLSHGSTATSPGLELTGDTVAKAAPGVGVLEGDRIVSVDGRPYAEAGLSPARDRVVTVVVERDGRTLAVPLPVRRYVVEGNRLAADPYATPKAIRLRNAYLATPKID
ncbi:MAG: M61 family metallopeptidase [Fimbriimonadaceae bacterium]|nr:M61 family metallopeptidase [Fimbriimonadaceae bacterium]